MLAGAAVAGYLNQRATRGLGQQLQADLRTLTAQPER
jgi:hypothetical protein